MNKRIELSAGALLMLAALWFFCGGEMLGAIALSAAAHEAGHLLALRLCGARVTGFKAGFGQLVIDCAGLRGALRQTAAAAAGPVSGALFSVACAWVGGMLGSRFLLCAAGVSAALSAVNITPALPLDGGRIVEALAGRRAAELLGLSVCVAVTLLGLVLAWEGYGWAAFIFGIWLTLFQAGL